MAGLSTFTVLSINGDTSLSGTRLFNKNRIFNAYTVDAGTMILYLKNTLSSPVLYDKYIVSDELTTVDDIYSDYSEQFISFDVYDDPTDVTSSTTSKAVPSEDIVYGLDIDASNAVIYVNENGVINKLTVNTLLATMLNASEPTVVNPIANQGFDEGFVSSTVNLAPVFNDADGDDLTYSVIVVDESVVTASVDGATLTITETGNGDYLSLAEEISSIVRVTASDGKGGTVTDNFVVTITGV